MLYSLFVNETNCVQIMFALCAIAFAGIGSLFFFKSTSRKPMVPVLIGILSLFLLLGVKDASKEYVDGSPSQAWGEEVAAYCIGRVVGEDSFPSVHSYRHFSTKVSEPSIFPQEELRKMYREQ